jgi:hypothetical protein
MNLNRKVSVAALTLLLAASGVFAQVKRKPTPAPDRPLNPVNQLRGDLLPVDPNVIIGKLPNGLTYYIRKNAQPKTGPNFTWLTKPDRYWKPMPSRAWHTLPSTWRLTVPKISQRTSW